MTNDSAEVVADLLGRPWTVETGVKSDGTRWARCAELPHAIAYADPDEDLAALFWDSLRSSLEAMVAAGEMPEAPRLFADPPFSEEVLIIAQRIQQDSGEVESTPREAAPTAGSGLIAWGAPVAA